MPLNEASAPRSNLTARQRRAQLAAIYGVPEPDEFDTETIRRLLSREDAEHGEIETE